MKQIILPTMIAFAVAITAGPAFAKKAHRHHHHRMVQVAPYGYGGPYAYAAPGRDGPRYGGGYFTPEMQNFYDNYDNGYTFYARGHHRLGQWNY